VPLTTEQALSWVDRLYKTLVSRRPEVKTFDNYYRGVQPLAMSSDIWREFHAHRYEKFADNWCGVVADAPAQRMGVVGFRLDADSSMSDDEKTLSEDWKRNDMELQSAQGILETVKSRRSFVLVWGDRDGNPVMTWEDPSQVVVAYDPEYPLRRQAALKTWVDDDLSTEYATLYTDDELWKFSRPKSRLVLPHGSAGWVPREVPEDDAWPLANPMGAVPMVEVRNRGPLMGEPMSEIGGTMPMQDAINLLWAYLFVSADHASFPARVVLGMEAPSLPKLDENGQDTGQRIPVDLKSLANGRLLFLNEEGANPSVDQWDAAKLDVFTEVVETAIGHIAAQTRTPQHYLILGRNANPAAADALTAAEAGLVAKVHDLEKFASLGIREVHRLAALVRGNRRVADAATVGTVVWEDAENRSEAQKADAATKWRAVGMPFKWLVEKYATADPAEIERIMQMREEEADDPTMARIMREFRDTERVNDDAEV